ncbi:GNAT family N-acetyltransferase [Paenibacillus sp. OK003]|uniref:GNAT family N-acetyltransferase n=1 Tax=Paenibacillus sp. OK003 TaxID=1884380 RepID=UPI0008BD653C|nr:GNAT family N-acetyltransferase [Paenibacillus sp. OK003]SEL68209.1 GNAT acetyltransferase [Paenibacillus sp. OK003]
MNPILNLSPMDMMKIQANTLYTMDNQKRLLNINEPDGGQAPALFIGITSVGQCSYYHEQLPFTLIEELGCDAKLPLNIAKLIRGVETFKPVKSVWMGPAYAFPEKCGEWHPNVQLIESHRTFLLEKHFPDLIEHLHEKMPVAAYVMEDSAVAVCCSARVSQQGAEASLNTAPKFRGQGYAAEAVKCWQYHVKESGRIPIYSTSWDNIASQTVARKLGLIQFGVDFNITTSS